MEAGCMDKITTAKITDRLGGPPEQWTFFGQCFGAGGQTGLKCAILHQPSQYFFTLTPADGSPGHRYISFEAIRFFRARNPELYRRLMIGVGFLELQNDGFDRQERWRKEHGKQSKIDRLISDGSNTVRDLPFNQCSSKGTGPIYT